ncbi:unnamed protein product [Fusarium venenatum]|uniref:Uncharacterized protein n=1 Tax=Fusarium venenatum TaxID=56646 RepID=A0A2L2TXA0_9HYPO|nr:uncharacterized protein FVRRES_09343 [Fusarium venenatum]CEI69266.1 unnamed protein product [Fusarium venenatum]
MDSAAFLSCLWRKDRQSSDETGTVAVILYKNSSTVNIFQLHADTIASKRSRKIDAPI